MFPALFLEFIFENIKKAEINLPLVVNLALLKCAGKDDDCDFRHDQKCGQIGVDVFSDVKFHD